MVQLVLVAVIAGLTKLFGLKSECHFNPPLVWLSFLTTRSSRGYFSGCHLHPPATSPSHGRVGGHGRYCDLKVLNQAVMRLMALRLAPLGGRESGVATSRPPGETFGWSGAA